MSETLEADDLVTFRRDMFECSEEDGLVMLRREMLENLEGDDLFMFRREMKSKECLISKRKKIDEIEGMWMEYKDMQVYESPIQGETSFKDFASSIDVIARAEHYVKTGLGKARRESKQVQNVSRSGTVKRR